MKRKLLAVLLSFCMVISMAPAAFAANSVFTDVNAGDWFAEEVRYVFENDLMKGTADDKFDPAGSVTRAMVWTTLARLYGIDTTTGETWWQVGQEWVMETGISDGTMPHENITREQLVTMMYRYALFVGVDVSVGEDTNILSYADFFDVHEWAISAMQWACGEGIITGDGENLMPRVQANRAQLAAILYRFSENVVNAPAVYTVTFMWNYGNEGVYRVVEVEKGETVGKLREPARDGYVFSGWYTAEGEAFDLDDAVNANITVYAKWRGDFVHVCEVISKEVVEATCSEGGYVLVTTCCYEYKTDRTDPDPDAHDWDEYVSNNDGTHTRICLNNEEHEETEDCSFTDNVCDFCGYTDGAVAMIGDVYYESIEEAIKAAEDGDTVYILGGTYDKVELDDIDGLWHNKNNNEGTLYQNTLQYAGPSGNEYDPEKYPEIYNEDYAIFHKPLADNITITAAEGAEVIIAGMDIYSDKGLYGVDYAIKISQATKDVLCVAKNLTITGITFTDDLALKGAFIDGWSIEDCEFTDGACINTNHNSHNKKSGAANVNIVGCTFTGSDSDSATQETRIILYKVDGAVISDNIIEGAEFNAIQLGSPDEGVIEISDNTISGAADRIIRASNSSASEIIISGNTVTGDGRNGEVIKIDFLDGEATLDGNTWNGYDDDMLAEASGIWTLPIEAPDTGSELGTLLQTAANGSTIILDAVSYGKITLGGGHFNASLPKNITIIGSQNASVDFAVNKSSDNSIPFDGVMDSWRFVNVNFVGDGFRLQNGATANNIELEGCSFTDGATFYSLAAEGGYVSGAKFIDCSFTDTVNSSVNKNAISIQDAEDISIEGCTFENVRNAINFGAYAAGEIVIHNNTVTVTSDRVIRVTDDGAVYTITENTITSDGDAGQMIKIDGVDVNKVTLDGNTWNGYEDDMLAENGGIWSLNLVP